MARPYVRTEVIVEWRDGRTTREDVRDAIRGCVVARRMSRREDVQLATVQATQIKTYAFANGRTVIDLDDASEASI